jgi:hypothetical protein
MRIIENALTEEQYSNMCDTYKKDITVGVTQLPELPSKFVKPLLDICGQFYDLSEAKSLEYWQYDFLSGWTLPVDWHYDHEQRSFVEDNLLKIPIFSAIYYPFIEDMKGGEICFSLDSSFTKVYKHKPVANTMLIFDPLVWHKTLQAHSTRRCAFMMGVYLEDNIQHHLYDAPILNDSLWCFNQDDDHKLSKLDKPSNQVFEKSIQLRKKYEISR